MEIDALRNKVREECERCFAPRPLNVTDNAKPPNTVKDTELSKHVIEIAKVNIKNLFYKKFNDGIISISDKKEIIDLENISYKEKIEKFTNSTLNGYASKRFLNLFKDGLITSEEQHKRIIAATKFDSRTIREFLKGKTIPDEKTLDLFSTFIQFAGWNNFKLWIKNQPNSDNSTSISPKINFQSNKFSKEKLEIAGATIIDEDFIEEIKTRNFSMTEFYTAKQDENCQWYGVVQGWDIQREIHNEIKYAIDKCFEKQESDKVAAILYGNGGIGKSCLLRKIAVELCAKSTYTILWMNNFENFFEVNQNQNIPPGIELIKNNPSVLFILIIEDWYSLEGINGSRKSKKILIDARNIANIRLVIGDRYIHGKEYQYHLYNENNLFELKASENRKIISQIINKVPEWDIYFQEVISENIEKVPLFMILFIMAKTHENKDVLNVNLSSPQNAFKEIIRDDILQLIKYNCTGLAKALHYLSCIYSKYRFQISYKSFLQIAEQYNSKNNRKLKEYENIHLNSKISKIINIYIGRDNNEEENILHFNHDIFSDNGLNKISIPNWDLFDDEVVKVFLGTIINNEDGMSASKFLEIVLKNHPSVLNKKETKEYFNILINKKVRGSYLDILCDLALNEKDVTYFATRLLKSNLNTICFWKQYSKILDDSKYINENILTILTSMQNPSAIVSILRFNVNDTIFQKMIETENWMKISPLAVRCLKTSHNKINDNLKFKFINNVLCNDEWQKIPSPTIDFCLDNSELELKKKFAEKIIKYSQWNLIDPKIICDCLEYIPKNKQKQFSDELFQVKHFDNVHESVISKCLIISKNKEIALSYLEDWKNCDIQIFHAAFKCFENEKKLPIIIERIIEEIFNNYSKLSDRSYTRYYLQLLRINLSSIPVWVVDIENILNNWNTINRTFIYHVEKPLKLTTHFRMKLTTCFGAN